MKTAIELADAIDNSEETTGFERRCASMLRTLSQENEALKADAERLDLLDKTQTAYGTEDYHEGNSWEVGGPFRSVREAIDAMKGKS